MIKHKFLSTFIFTIILTSLSAQNEINTFDDDGKRHGIWRKNYPKTNQIRYQGQFVHGKEVDTFKYYKLKRKKSVLSAIKVFNLSNNNADVTFMASNGSIVSKGKMQGKRFIGEWRYFHKNSKNIMIKEFYDSVGELEGKRTIYFFDGGIADESNYANGLLNGVSKIYSETGKLLQESLYLNGKLDGLTTYYDTFGNIKAKGAFKANIKTGIWEYFEGGKLIRKVDHDNNKVLFKKQ